MQNLAGLLYVVNLYSSRCCKTNTIPVFFEDGKFVVQTEGVTKVWCECGDVYKLGIFKTYCWEWMMLVEIQSFFGLGDLFFRHANVSIDYAPAI